VPAEILEQIMSAVQRDSSEEVLRLVDRLVTEGQNPTHFARQMVRFLRNALVAKVAGSSSPLLQISTDERDRAARVAEPFSEEDLARFLQILLRTHSELGYKQEQRFHLELGLLKMVHAQRLLPVEQLLSGAAPPANVRPPVTAARGPAGEAPPARPSATTVRGGSPFATDLARKGTPRSDAAASPGSAPPSRSAAESRRGGSDQAATAVTGASESTPPAVPPASQPNAPRPGEQGTPESELPGRVIAAAEGAGLNDLANMLRRGEWKTIGSDVMVEVPDPQVLVQMVLSRKEADQVMNTAASGVLGRSARVKLVSGGKEGAASLPPRSTGNGGSHNRAAEEPVVRRLQEKFGAEIRSIIDYREKD
jgi:DNA polymerase-3 subunit gamma/tau